MYDYRTEYGELFSVVAPTLKECRQKERRKGDKKSPQKKKAKIRKTGHKPAEPEKTYANSQNIKTKMAGARGGKNLKETKGKLKQT